MECSFFYDPIAVSSEAASAEAVAIANELIAKCRKLPDSLSLFISTPPIPVKVAELTAERLLGLIPAAKIYLAESIVGLVQRLGHEARPGPYYLEILLGEIDKLPLFGSFGYPQFSLLQNLKKKGLRLTDLPDSLEGTSEGLLKLSQESGIAVEFLLGNLEKSLRLIKLLEVRNFTVNLSTLFHNFQSGFLDVDPQEFRENTALQLLERAKALEAQGTTWEVFQDGEFHKKLVQLDGSEVAKLAEAVDQDYELPRGAFLQFCHAVLAGEEKRLGGAIPLTLRDLVAAFRFSSQDRDQVSAPAVIPQDDPSGWKNTDLGKSLMALRTDLSGLAVATGIRSAGDLEAQQNDPKLLEGARHIKQLAGGFSITLFSGRGGKKSEQRISQLEPKDILFDLYGLAVLEKRPLPEVLKTALHILQFIRNLENRDPVVNLGTLLTSRLAGAAYVTLLGKQGLILRNGPIVTALEKLRNLGGKVELTVAMEDGRHISIQDIGVQEFRRAIILMGRGFRNPHSPERVISVISDRLVPEILWLPPQVIEPGPHDLSRLVELALEGIPARYPLRRHWRKINLDEWVTMGSCLEPGIRNCLSCPVNALYGLVMKTALASGFEEIITYEATGCFEVYSGIWPYTGKKFPTVHGVFGGAPSEMLGGYAAKRARARFAQKQRAQGEQAEEMRRVLHLGWGGDGATFDIGFGNLSGLFSRLQKLSSDDLASDLHQRALYVCYDNEGYQNTGNQYSAASAPGGNTTTNPKGKNRSLGNDLRKKPIVEMIAEHGVPLAARMNIHRQEHIVRVSARALEDGVRGSFLHFLQPCTTGWKFVADSLTYDLSYLSEEGALFPPVTIEHGVAYLEMYPIPRNPGEAFLKLQARFKHLMGNTPTAKQDLQLVMNYYREEWLRNLKLAGFNGEIPQADRLGYLEDEHRMPRGSV